MFMDLHNLSRIVITIIMMMYQFVDMHHFQLETVIFFFFRFLLICVSCSVAILYIQGQPVLMTPQKMRSTSVSG